MDYKYDVFVSYRWVKPDETWVRERLVPALKTAGLKVLLDVVDFVPGRDLILEMTRAGSESRRAVCVISPDYFEDNRMVSFESLMARRLDPSGADSRVIPLIFRQTQLPEWLRGLIPIDWTREEDRLREWKKLLTTLGAPQVDAPLPDGAPQEIRAVVETPVGVIPKYSWESVNPAIVSKVFVQAFVVCGLALLARILWEYPGLLNHVGLDVKQSEVPFALNRAVQFGFAGFIALLLVWIGVMDTQFVLSLSKVLLFVSLLGLACSVLCCIPAISHSIHRILLILFIVAGSLYFFAFGMARYYWKMRSYGDVAAEGLVFLIFAYVMWVPLKMLFGR